MSKKTKRLARLLQNSKNVRFEELEGILISFGFTERKRGGSHVVFSLKGERLVIPRQIPFIRDVYIKLVLEKLDEMGLLTDKEGD